MATTLFVARQPILDRDRRVVAYELLFRDGFGSGAFNVDGTAATSHVMSASVLHFGIEALTGGAPAYINVTRDVLLGGLLHALPPERIVPEILEDVPPDAEVLAACRELKRRGFRIALDDVTRENRPDLLALADIVKVDFLKADAAHQAALAQRFGGRAQLVAEKVETPEAFRRALDLGYHAFQGFFFARPETMSRSDIPAHQHHYLNLLRELNRPGVRLDEIGDLIRRDLSLTYRLLMYLNSAHFGLRHEVRSIRHALTLLGEREIRRWATLIALASLGSEKPGELIVMSLCRGRMLERAAELIGRADEAQDLFLLGLLSMLDAIVDCPLGECLQGLPLAAPLADALAGKPGPYRDALDLVIAYESAEWSTVFDRARKLGASPGALPELYLEAARWSRETFAETRESAVGAPRES
jgi:EAL and modified HD-GYP domain-containing signal transduction protein